VIDDREAVSSATPTLPKFRWDASRTLAPSEVGVEVETRRLRGVVRTYDARRGWGLIVIGNTRYFAHKTELVDVLELRAGDRVTFEAVETERGPRATNIAVEGDR
jgi:cold shock CspA family protein